MLQYLFSPLCGYGLNAGHAAVAISNPSAIIAMHKAVLTHLRDDCLATGIHLYSPFTERQFHHLLGLSLKRSGEEANWVQLTNLPQYTVEGPRDSEIIA